LLGHKVDFTEAISNAGQGRAAETGDKSGVDEV